MKTAMPLTSTDRLHQFAIAVRDAIEVAKAELNQPLAPGESADDLAFAVLDSTVVAILDAILAACDGEGLTPARLVSYITRLAETQHLRAGDLLALQPWVVGVPIVGYIAPDGASGDDTHVFFYDKEPTL